MSLLEYKKSTGKTFKQLSEETHIPQSTLHRICLGKRPNLTTAEKLVKNVPLSIEDLINGGNGK